MSAMEGKIPVVSKRSSKAMEADKGEEEEGRGTGQENKNITHQRVHFDRDNDDDDDDNDNDDGSDNKTNLKQFDSSDAMEVRRRRHRSSSNITMNRRESIAELTLPKSTCDFLTPPKQRQRWSDEQELPHVNWGDLFFDLFYVGMAYNLSQIIRESPTTEGLLYFCGCFGPVFMFWSDKMYYDSRFEAGDDIVHRCLEVLQLCVLATSVLHIRPVEYMSNARDFPDMFVFALSLLVGNAWTLLRAVEIMIWVDGEPAAKISARRDARNKFIPIGCFLAATIVAGRKYDFLGDNYYPNDDTETDYYLRYFRFLATKEELHQTEESFSTNVPIYLCLFGYVSSLVWQVLQIAFFLPGQGQHKKVVVPMNIDYTIHRYGEWTMLMLGESVLSLLIVDHTETGDYYGTFYAGLISVILMQYLHFRSQPHNADDHAMRRSKSAGVTFSVLMQIYSAALILIGVSYKMFLYEYTYEDGYEGRRRLLRRMSSFVAPGTKRFLAGGGGGSESEFSTKDRQQRIANFFCGSMAIAWFTLDSMILTHKGLRTNTDRCWCSQGKGRIPKIGILLIGLRIGLIAFIATLSQYETDPEKVAGIGLAGIVAQVVLRLLGDVFFPSDKVEPTDSHNDNGDSLEPQKERGSYHDPEENKWPNVTHPRSTPVDEPHDEGV